jgi:hypothetical protein
MSRTNLERVKVYEIAKIIATTTYRKKCCEDGCSNCDENGACTPVEMAWAIVGVGYELNTNAQSAIREGDASHIEDLAKTIASSRGYGCTSSDSCAKCCCQSLECVPFGIAEILLQAGCMKKGEV